MTPPILNRINLFNRLTISTLRGLQEETRKLFRKVHADLAVLSYHTVTFWCEGRRTLLTFFLQKSNSIASAHHCVHATFLLNKKKRASAFWAFFSFKDPLRSSSKLGSSKRTQSLKNKFSKTKRIKLQKKNIMFRIQLLCDEI